MRRAARRRAALALAALGAALTAGALVLPLAALTRDAAAALGIASGAIGAAWLLLLTGREAPGGRTAAVLARVGFLLAFAAVVFLLLAVRAATRR